MSVPHAADANAPAPEHHASTTAGDYWGDLIQADKRPSPLLEALLAGIAEYINEHVRRPHAGLRPTKVAAFYRAVGGNYDSLFLETPPPSLSFIYQALGCSHSLEPTSNDFAPPSVPTLNTRGFIRWQTIQLLLGPEEHVRYLQEAVRKFDIVNPLNGEVFPRDLPRTSLPSAPDDEMVQWHNSTTERLRQDAEDEARRLESRIGHEKERSMNGSSPVGAGVRDHLTPYDSPSWASAGNGKNRSAPLAGTPFIHPSQSNGASSPPRRRRRRSYNYPSQYYTVPQTSYFPHVAHRDAPLHRPGDLSDAEVFSSGSSSGRSSDDDDTHSDIHSSNRSSPDVPRHRHGDGHRHRSSHHSSSSRSRRTHYTPRYDSDSDSDTASDSSSPSLPSTSSAGSRRGGQDKLHSNLPPSYFSPRPPLQQQPHPPKVNYRGANVRWANENDVLVFTPPAGSVPSTPGVDDDEDRGGRDRGHGPPKTGRLISDGKSSGRRETKRVGAEVSGVHGRRYPEGGVRWR